MPVASEILWELRSTRLNVQQCIPFSTSELLLDVGRGIGLLAARPSSGRERVAHLSSRVPPVPAHYTKCHEQLRLSEPLTLLRTLSGHGYIDKSPLRWFLDVGIFDNLSNEWCLSLIFHFTFSTRTKARPVYGSNLFGTTRTGPFGVWAVANQYALRLQ